MERIHAHKVNRSRRKEVVLGTTLALVLSAGMQSANASGQQPIEATVIPESDFRPVILYESEQKSTPSATSYGILMNEMKINPVSKQEQAKIQMREEKDKVISNMKDHPELFPDKYIQDVEMYYPIYKAVADKFHIDWYLLWIVHEAETGASADGSRGLKKESYYKGAMQRDPNTWSENFVEEASKGLEYLADFPQRQKNDWREIAAGAAILDRNIDHYIKLGESKDSAVHKSLLLYSADGPAERRFALYEEQKKIFSN